MASHERGEYSVPANRGRFATTHWSLVLAAGQGGSPQAREALATLCAAYWYPLYVYARRRLGHVDQAQDLTQEFFAHLLEKEALRVAVRERGRFRSFLLTAFKNFLAKERERASAKKRGGGRVPIPLDFSSAERRYHLEPTHEMTPERIYQRRWALTLLEQVFGKLRAELAAAGRLELFERLKCCLTGEGSAETYARIGIEVKLSEGAVKVAVHRLRRRYRELLREEIAHTVDSLEEVDEELRDIFEAVRRRP